MYNQGYNTSSPKSLRVVNVLVSGDDKMDGQHGAPTREQDGDNFTFQDCQEGYSTTVVQRNTGREKLHNTHFRDAENFVLQKKNKCIK